MSLIGIYPEWNVKAGIVIAVLAAIDWNISRMECKVLLILFFPNRKLNWNISRMECKVVSTLSSSNRTHIGIYPEWNVKLQEIRPVGLSRRDWNISRMECKAVGAEELDWGKANWNISRMECKGLLRR